MKLESCLRQLIDKVFSLKHWIRHIRLKIIFSGLYVSEVISGLRKLITVYT